MEPKMSNKATTVLEAHPMNGGDGTYSYTKNSYYQREAANVAQTLIGDVIAMKLDINEFASSSTNAFCIADLGCSVGPNTFVSVENILEAIKHKYRSECMSSQTREFQVFFNDHAGNDFNTLFAKFPPTRNYFAAGVPGSFHGRLFPKSSLHVVHSSYATHWLSKVPEELTDKNSPAWNKGKIHYTTAPEEVVNAYAAQFTKDMAAFLEARAQELVVGGMMILILPAVPTGIPHSRVPNGVMFDFMGSILIDMAKEGVISEAEVDSFNLPVYTTSPKEMGELVERNGRFHIEQMESTSPWLEIKHSNSDYGKTLSMSLRAGMEGVLRSHFGSEITNQLFNRLCDQSGQLTRQLQESCCREGTQLFVALKRI
ncbi:PREDICTED: probable S-adenosylmethionine-dependent methyltransferase At5g37990-like [Fragaria vesca subsp. vesca]